MWVVLKYKKSEFNFLKMMEFFESNQKTQINFIKQIPTIMKSDNIRLREKSLDLLERIQDDVDRAYLVMIQNNMYEEMGTLSSQTTRERKKILVSYADKILNALLTKYTQKHIRVPIQKYFQNNGAKFEFKI